jgi:hypothetical protein
VAPYRRASIISYNEVENLVSMVSAFSFLFSYSLYCYRIPKSNVVKLHVVQSLIK